MSRVLALILLFINISIAKTDTNETALSFDEIERIQSINKRIDAINESIKNNIWQTRYNNFLTYQKLTQELKVVIAEEKSIKNKKNQEEKLEEINKRKETLVKQMELLSEYKKDPFEKLIEVPAIKELEKIGNPIAVISGFSYIKQLRGDKEEYKKRLESLDLLIETLKDKEKLLQEIQTIELTEKIQKRISTNKYELNEFKGLKDISRTTFSVYEKRLEEAISRASLDIKEQMKRAFNIASFIISVIVLSFLFKLIAKKYITDNERFYTANKFINLVNVTLIIVILLFAYIENVTYLVTVLGFASAGIAIAMKDMFMSMLGWTVIVFGGSFHVGDRVKVSKDGLVYVGDIMDISLLRITIFEDITLTTYKENRRSGRIIFIPNNYIFTNLISNYTHQGMKTVWDGLDVTISFDSNVKKAMYIVKNLTKKYSQGYTDIAKKQMNKLRSQYSLKNTNVEPRIYSFLEPHGLNISVWYMTNSYAALVLRSTLSSEIIEAFNKEEDIKIAYPTQTIYVDKKPSIRNLDVNEDVLF